MNFFYSILISQFVFLGAIEEGFITNTLQHTPSEKVHSCSTQSHSSDSVPDSNAPLPDVKIILEVTPDHHKHIHLKLVYRVLANQYLPVWTIKKKMHTIPSKDNSDYELKLVPGVMEQIGAFSFYQDPGTSSAAVYYHQRREFDGMIDTRYLISKLPLDRIHVSSKTKIPLGEFGIYIRSYSMDHPPAIPYAVEDSESNNAIYEIRETYENRLYSGYPEILIIVSSDMAQRLLSGDQNNPDRYTSLVSYVLTLFNGADMLYSKLKETNIKLNIAGIIIADEAGSSHFLKDCYDQSHDNVEPQVYMPLDASCVIQNMRGYLYDWIGTIPLDSYDATVFLTSNTLYFIKDGETYGLAGLARNKGVYNQKKSSELPGLIATISDSGQFRSYGVIAHELAHLMNVQHDKAPFVKDREYCGNIMKTEGTYWCANCLSWSQQSEESFKKFFSSADCCGFTNKPRSLYLPGPREMLTADEQCRCYGYPSTITFPLRIGRFCASLLLCENESDEIHPTVLPLDGTPCSSNKVCWRSECQTIPN